MDHIDGRVHTRIVYADFHWGQQIVGLPNLYELIKVDNVRSHPRFVVNRPLEGDHQGESATVRNISIGGFGLAHTGQLRVGSRVRFDLRDTEFDELITFRLSVVWSRMARDRNEAGQILYNSGSRIEDDLEQIGGKLGRLLRYYGKPESDSMEIKRIRALSRLMKRVSMERKLQLEIEPVDLMLCYQALHQTSLMSAEEAQALAREATDALANSAGGWSREVLAAWKLTESKVDPRTIETARKFLAEIDRVVKN